MTPFLILCLLVLCLVIVARIDFTQEHASDADELLSKWHEGAYGRAADQLHADLSKPYRDEINDALREHFPSRSM